MTNYEAYLIVKYSIQNEQVSRIVPKLHVAIIY